MPKSKTRDVLEGVYYSNTLVISKTNKPLTTLAEKRVNWYLNRDLAEDVTQEFKPKDGFEKYDRIIRLKFVSKAEDKSTDPFFQQVLETKCVVCGKVENLTLHHVVPSAVRKHFPEEHKNHAHGWCVLLCEQHHNLADKLAYELHEQEIRELDRLILQETKRLRKEWGEGFIKRLGGIEGTKNAYREKFLTLNPEHLPDGFLEDHKLPEEIFLTSEKNLADLEEVKSPCEASSDTKT